MHEHENDMVEYRYLVVLPNGERVEFNATRFCDVLGKTTFYKGDGKRKDSFVASVPSGSGIFKLEK
jgi:hypothetical protein